MAESCGKFGPHRFYVAETVAVLDEGKVHVIALCTDCGEAIMRSFTVARPHAMIQINEKQKAE